MKNSKAVKLVTGTVIVMGYAVLPSSVSGIRPAFDLLILFKYFLPKDIQKQYIEQIRKK